MIEVSRSSGGFARFNRGEQAVARYLCELLIAVRNENPSMEPDARVTFADRLGELLTTLDEQGYRRSVTIGELTFSTGR